MTIENARKFIRRAAVDNDFRKQLNKADGEAGRMGVLLAEEIPFNFQEFDEAYTNLVCNCQAQEDHEQLKELRMWWEMLIQMG